MPEVMVFIRLLHFAAAISAFGAAAFRFYVPGSGDGVFGEGLARLVRHAASVAFVAALAMVPATAASMAGTGAAAFEGATLRTVLTATQFGHVWCWHLGFAALVIVFSGRRLSPLAFAFAALSLASLAWAGHAAAIGGLAGLAHEANQAVHLLAAGAWLGGLLPLWLLLRRAAPAGAAEREAVVHFSQMGYAAVGLIAITGLVNTCLLVGSVGALFDTAYGRLLTVKIALYLAMVAVALANRLLLAPRLEERGAALGCSILVEQALGLAIIAAISVLGTWPPAADHVM